jgi:hypothetical protein
VSKANACSANILQRRRGLPIAGDRCIARLNRSVNARRRASFRDGIRIRRMLAILRFLLNHTSHSYFTSMIF